MGIRDHNWTLGKYNSDQVNLLREHVIPLLSVSKYYDRSVAYLKASHLNDISLELLEFAEKGGIARYLIGNPLDYKNLLAIQNSLANGNSPEYLREIQQKLTNILSDSSFDTNGDLPNVVLQYLIATKQLEIRIIIRAGLHHEKVRIGRDESGDIVVCCGSDNDSTAALTGPNRESGILVYNWAYPGTDYWNTHGQPSVLDFERDWNNENDESFTLCLDDEVLEEITRDWESRQISRENLYKRLKELKIRTAVDDRNLRDYQEDAIEAWQDADYKGIMALCTGAGKTFTAITAARRLADYWTEQGRSFAIIVAVPYKILAHQWKKELSLFFPEVIGCWSDFPSWKGLFDAQLYSCFGLHSRPSIMTAVVVNDTLLGTDFNDRLARIPAHSLLWIGDEVHQHASVKFKDVIPQADYVLGLSATPWSSGQSEKARLLTEIYGSIIAQFGIKEALENEVLVPYFYQLSIISLTADETEEYGKISGKLAPFLAKDISNLSPSELRELSNLVRSRAAIIGSCSEKLDWLDNFSKSKKLHHTLIYCAEGSIPSLISTERQRALEYIAGIFDRNGWSLARITAEESLQQRELILDTLSKGEIEAILAIRVLDEGFDLPLCRHAFILSSSRNERQFIQRRGRVLRKHPSKNNATI
ncbi:MAG: DEAD/DEAH box helicase family protein, partial [Pseudobdellovibrionaceae bacterium]